jgi:diaminopimelate decarboxylase
VINEQDLAARFGTPLYVYDLDRVAAAYRDLRRTLPAGFTVFYSLKANPHPGIARALREAGGEPLCRAEVSSSGELDAALAAGFAPGECLYTGPGKTGPELAAAVSRGVRTFSVESLGDLERVGCAAARTGTAADCLLRVNQVSSQAATSIRMTGAPSQFGIDSETLPDLLPRLRTVPGTRLTGAHFYSLSNARDEASLVAELRQSLATAGRLHRELGLPMRLLDIGGGFGAPYAVPGQRPRYGRLRSELEQALDLSFPRWRSGTPQLACESGRYLAGDCGTLITAVTNVKHSRGQRFVIVDAGINTLGGMAGLGRLMPLAASPAGPTDRAGPGMPSGAAGPGTGAGPETARLVGPLCTPGDVLGRDVPLPPLEPGDVLAIPNVGAYGPTASLLLFLGRPAPQEVVVRGDEIVSVSRLDVHRAYSLPETL